MCVWKWSFLWRGERCVEVCDFLETSLVSSHGVVAVAVDAVLFC